MSLPERYNPRFIQYYEQRQQPDLQTLGDYDVSIQLVEEPEAYKVIGVHHLSGQENAGKHHIYVDVLDEQGQRINGAQIAIMPQDGFPSYAIVDKPPNEPGTNAPMWGGGQYEIRVAHQPSDRVLGLSTAHPDEPGGGNTWGHHSFYVVFQRVASAEPVEPEPEQPPVEQPPVDDETIQLIIDTIIEIKTDIKAIRNWQREQTRIDKQQAAITMQADG